MTASAVRHRAPARTRWLLPERPDPAVVARLVDELRLPEPVCRLLATRGHHVPDAAKLFLRPRLEQLLPPDGLTDLEKAVERITRAIRGRETILVHGDYDVDGICATTLLTRTLQGLGATVVPFIPHRLTDGYDLTNAGVEAARRVGATLVVTADCGTSAHAPIEKLVGLGIDVVVTDHHLPGGPLPPAYAVINPKQPGDEYPDKDLAAVGIAFKLSQALVRALGANENLVLGQLDLVALATIADIVPLRGENRVLARYGLKLLGETRNLGLRALIRAAGLDGKPLTAGRVGYILAPRLNAVGRLGHALRGVELLLSRTEHEANTIARELEELNRKRQDVDRGTQERARALVAGMDLDETYGIVLAEDGWHAGVIGIVASRIVEEFGRPTVLIALEGDEGKGSGRSISRFDLHAGLSECRDLLVRFGGHTAAAGVTISRDRVREFAERFNRVARERLTAEDLVPELRVDLEVALADCTFDLHALLSHLEPCGAGNPAPVLVARDARVAASPQVVGQGALKLRLDSPAGGAITALGWGMGARAPELRAGDRLEVAFRLERDDWNGEQRLQARLADFRVLEP